MGCSRPLTATCRSFRTPRHPGTWALDNFLVCLWSGIRHCQGWILRHTALARGRDASDDFDPVWVHGCPCLSLPGLPQPDRLPSQPTQVRLSGPSPVFFNVARSPSPRVPDSLYLVFTLAGSPSPRQLTRPTTCLALHRLCRLPCPFYQPKARAPGLAARSFNVLRRYVLRLLDSPADVQV